MCVVVLPLVVPSTVCTVGTLALGPLPPKSKLELSIIYMITESAFLNVDN